MTTATYYRHIRSLGAFRAVEALALAREAAELDTAARVRALGGPSLVCWEDGEVKLSFAIKVF
jgi:hypothetical protein